MRGTYQLVFSSLLLGKREKFYRYESRQLWWNERFKVTRRCYLLIKAQLHNEPFLFTWQKSMQFNRDINVTSNLILLMKIQFFLLKIMAKKSEIFLFTFLFLRYLSLFKINNVCFQQKKTWGSRQKYQQENEHLREWEG